MGIWECLKDLYVEYILLVCRLQPAVLQDIGFFEEAKIVINSRELGESQERNWWPRVPASHILETDQFVKRVKMRSVRLPKFCAKLSSISWSKLWGCRWCLVTHSWIIRPLSAASWFCKPSDNCLDISQRLLQTTYCSNQICSCRHYILRRSWLKRTATMPDTILGFYLVRHGITQKQSSGSFLLI